VNCWILLEICFTIMNVKVVVAKDHLIVLVLNFHGWCELKKTSLRREVS